MTIKGTGRYCRFKFSFSTDDFIVTRFSGTDRMQDIFECRVELLTDRMDSSGSVDKMIGHHGTVMFGLDSENSSCFDGLIQSATWLGQSGQDFKFALDLVAWPYLATLQRQQRIFHNAKVTDILDTVLNHHTDGRRAKLKDDTTKTYPVLPYTVQYDESDYDFACRLMDRFGINFHFTHDNDGHTMVLTDGVDALPTIKGGTRMLGLYDHGAHTEEESFHAIAQRANVQTGVVKLTDYNFETPKAMMETAATGKASHPHGKLESVEFPGSYPDAGRGRTVAETRLAQVRQGASMFNGAGNVASLRPGMKIRFTPPPGKALPDFVKGKTFICLGASYDATGDRLGDVSMVPEESAPFNGSFTFLDAADGIVPTRRTRPARILGPQTAEVVGAGEIDCDEYGRILVRFHWDLAEAESMRCRVSQNWAGKGWGGMVIPRVGMEVIVQFLNGDPDCPIVTGCVYNGDNTVPEGLPDAKTKSIFRSNSSGGVGFNELAFEDQAGEELVYFHAQKDHTLEILNDRDITVGHDQIEKIDNDKTSTVTGNHTETIKKSVSHKVTQSLTQEVGVSMDIKTITYELNGSGKTTIIGGGSKIELSPGMVTITAPVIRLAGKVIMG